MSAKISKKKIDRTKQNKKVDRIKEWLKLVQAVSNWHSGSATFSRLLMFQEGKRLVEQF